MNIYPSKLSECWNIQYFDQTELFKLDSHCSFKYVVYLARKITQSAFLDIMSRLNKYHIPEKFNTTKEFNICLKLYL